MSLSTPHQRLYIRTMLQQLELCTRSITLLHRRLFDLAKLPAQEMDRTLDGVLCALTREQASALIGVLKQETAGLS